MCISPLCTQMYANSPPPDLHNEWTSNELDNYQSARMCVSLSVLCVCVHTFVANLGGTANPVPLSVEL